MSEQKTYDLKHITDPNDRNGIEFEKLRFEYAWRHFDFHAKQRTQMFHFFLISVTFLAGAYGALGSSQAQAINQLAPPIAIAGLIVSLIFMGLDFRNVQLYRRSQRYLIALEKQVLFATGFRQLFHEGKELRGIMFDDAVDRPWHCLRHGFLIPFCQGGAALLFAFLALRV